MSEGAGQETPERLSAGACAAVAAAFVALALMLIVAGEANLDRFNPDAVGYYQVASHLLADRWELAVTGYWGPLISWTMLPLLALRDEPIVAGRIAMGLSAFLFLLGGVLLLRRLLRDGATLAVGAWLLAAFGLVWSVKLIGADLLVGGLLSVALAVLLGQAWIGRAGIALAAGALFGLAYLAKAVALPLGLALLLAVAVWRIWSGWSARNLVARSLLFSLLGFAIVAGPWIAVLSLKYGGPTFGTSGRINLAMAGPSYNPPGTAEFKAHHPTFVTFHRVREGRVTTWEEPSALPYRYWNPLASRADLSHLAHLVGTNLRHGLSALAGFDALALGLLATLAGAGLNIGRAGRALPLWRLAAAPVALNLALYLPVLSNVEPRYLMPAYPWLLAAALGAAAALAARLPGRAGISRCAAHALVAASFLYPMRHDLQLALTGHPNPYFTAARPIAAAMRESGLDGGIASVDELGFTPLFAAYLAGRPFQGTESGPVDPSELRALGIRFLAVRRDASADIASLPGMRPLRELAPSQAAALAAQPVAVLVLP